MYQPTWITSQLAAGPAPMSYADLDAIRAAGITAILNLCGEFSDLHRIEEQAGFDVYHLPVPDERAPAIVDLERALEWLDEAIYLNKKVLVHCRHGHGRTGTLISAYLVRKGLGLKRAEKILKNTRANPTNYSQWKLLRKYNRSQGVLVSADPSLENRNSVDLGPFLAEVEAVAGELDRELDRLGEAGECGRKDLDCCHRYFDLDLAETIHVHTRINQGFTREERMRVMERARDYRTALGVVERLCRNHPVLGESDRDAVFRAGTIACPLLEGGACLGPSFRPLCCRWHGTGLAGTRKEVYREKMNHLAEDIYLALTGSFPPRKALRFSMAETVSGRYVEACFRAMNQGREG